MTNSSLLAKCVLDYTYLFSKVTYTLTSLLTSLTQFFRAVWEAVSWAIVLSKSPNKTETHNSHVVQFFFPSVDIWFMFILVSVIEQQVLQWQYPRQTHGLLFPSNTTLFCFLVFFFFGHVSQHVRSLSSALEVQNLNHWATREVPQKHFVMRLSLFGSWNVPITNLEGIN